MSKKLILIAAACFVISGCSMKKTVINTTGLFMEDIVNSFLAEPDADFAREAAPANMKLLDGLIAGSGYENYDLLVKGCKLYAMYGMGFYEDMSLDKKTEKENLVRASRFYEKAMDYGFRALSIKPEFKTAKEGSLDEFVKVMEAYGKNDTEALFYCAFAWGSYINLNRNKTEAVASLPKVKAMMERVISLSPDFMYGMPHVFMIVYYSMPRMFGGDPEMARKAYDKIMDISGGKFVLADFFLAKYLAVSKLDEEMFDAALLRVANADESIIPEKLFTALAKRKAAVLKARKNDLF